MARGDLVAFGLAVRSLRTQRQLSQEKLAELSHLHRTYISGVERGERNLGILNVFRIARALQVRPSELLALAEGSAERPRGHRQR